MQENLLTVLKSVYDIINEDTSLKLIEKEWRFFYAHYIHHCYIMNYGKNQDDECNDTIISYSSNYFKKIFGDNYINIENYFIEKDLISILKYEDGTKKFSRLNNISSKLYYKFPKSELIKVEITKKNITNKLTSLFSGCLKDEYYNSKYTRLQKEKKNEIISIIEKYNLEYNGELEVNDINEFLFNNNIEEKINNIEEIMILDEKQKEILRKTKNILDNEMTCYIPDELYIKSITKKEEYESLVLPQLKGEGFNKPKGYKDIYERKESLRLELNKLYITLQKLISMGSNNYVSIDGYGYRLHTSYTNLDSDYRKYIKLNDNEIKSSDIVNCQPWLLSNLIDCPDFKKVCAEGSFYECFTNKQLTDEKEIEMDRNKIKTTFYNICYGFYQQRADLVSKELEDKKTMLYKFVAMFPKVWAYIVKTNTPNHKELCKQLQRLESDLMINNILYRLLNENISALTIHDSISVEEHNYGKMMDIIIEEIIKKGYSIPKFK